MNDKPHLVTIAGTVPVDTTVAVMAKSEEDAARMALDRARYDPTQWLNYGFLANDPVVADVSEETWDGLQDADQQHLLGPMPVETAE